MQATRDPPHARAPRDLSRWVLCVGLALMAHAAGAAALIGPWGKPFDDVVSAPAIVVELTPVAVAPETAQIDLSPGPQQVEAVAEPAKSKPPPESEPEQTVTASVPTPQVTVPAEPAPDMKSESTPRRDSARATTAPSPAPRRAQRTAAPSPGTVAQSTALPGWRSALVAQLERSKRYPADAGGARGVAVLAFNIDRQGRVHQARITRSSGSSALDRETLALAARAQPLPPPPAELPGAQIPIAVPLRYNMD